MKYRINILELWINAPNRFAKYLSKSHNFENANSFIRNGNISIDINSGNVRNPSKDTLAPTLLANNARFLTLNLEIRLAGSLVWKTLGKFK